MSSDHQARAWLAREMRLDSTYRQHFLTRDPDTLLVDVCDRDSTVALEAIHQLEEAHDFDLRTDFTGLTIDNLIALTAVQRAA